MKNIYIRWYIKITSKGWGIMENVFINFEKEIFKGNVLDVGLKNYGIVYDLCKNNDEAMDVEYVEGKEEKKFIAKNSYDSCVAFFALKDLILDSDKKNFFKDMFEFMKNNATMYLWDIDKSVFRTFRGRFKVALPDSKVKEIEIKDFNILSDNSCNKICNMMKPYFNIIDVKCSNNVYYIKAQKKGSQENGESAAYCG